MRLEADGRTNPNERHHLASLTSSSTDRLMFTTGTLAGRLAYGPAWPNTGSRMCPGPGNNTGVRRHYTIPPNCQSAGRFRRLLEDVVEETRHVNLPSVSRMLVDSSVIHGGLIRREIPACARNGTAYVAFTAAVAAAAAAVRRFFRTRWRRSVRASASLQSA